MVGWDFSRLDGRLTADEPEWDFNTMCVDAMTGALSVLDIGTGGGERLVALCERLGDSRPPRLVATEGWTPNVALAQQRLQPAGIEVIEYDAEGGEPMPFSNGLFDVVMSCHEFFDAIDVARVLQPGGVVLTQQVHGRDAEELRHWFGGQPVYPDATLEHDIAAATAAGLVVEVQGEWTGHMSFSDAEALVEYMGLVPWNVPNFTVEEHILTLTDLDASRPITVSQHRYWYRARKPAQYDNGASVSK